MISKPAKALLHWPARGIQAVIYTGKKSVSGVIPRAKLERITSNAPSTSLRSGRGSKKLIMSGNV